MSASSPEGREDYQPSASLENLRARATLIAGVRTFFDERGVLEVETPLLCPAGVVDAHLDPFVVGGDSGDSGFREVTAEGEDDAGRSYLMTSPELCMKRLLAAGSGPIYQLTRAFRRGERGRLHNPEFTILEWYRPGRGLQDLMDEVEALVREVFRVARGGRARAGESSLWDAPFERVTYQRAFERTLDIDPLEVTVESLRALARERGVAAPPGMDARSLERAGPTAATRQKDDWLNLLLPTCVEGSLGREVPAFLYNYPASQAALARLVPGDARVAERFELYIDGIELANGYHELTDAAEQRRRFEAANEERRARGKEPLPLDAAFLRALESGLPDCSGVAVGLDRLLLLALGGSSLEEVMAFPASRV